MELFPQEQALLLGITLLGYSGKRDIFIFLLGFLADSFCEVWGVRLHLHGFASKLGVSVSPIPLPVKEAEDVTRSPGPCAVQRTDYTLQFGIKELPCLQFYLLRGLINSALSMEGTRLEGTSGVTSKEEMFCKTFQVSLPLFPCMISKVQFLQTGMKVFNVRA